MWGIIFWAALIKTVLILQLVLGKLSINSGEMYSWGTYNIDLTVTRLAQYKKGEKFGKTQNVGI
jgi:hypothetical protein